MPGGLRTPREYQHANQYSIQQMFCLHVTIPYEAINTSTPSIVTNENQFIDVCQYQSLANQDHPYLLYPAEARSIEPAQ
jgi:hypothetical protein